MKSHSFARDLSAALAALTSPRKPILSPADVAKMFAPRPRSRERQTAPKRRKATR